MQSLLVPQAYGMPIEHDRPVVALSPKDVSLADAPTGARWSRLHLYPGLSYVISSLLAASLRCSRRLKPGSDLLED